MPRMPMHYLQHSYLICRLCLVILDLGHFESCAQVALPFLCQYMFPLSDCSTGTSYSATRDDCIMISEGVCANVWDLGLRFGYDLPNCDELPNGKYTQLVIL